MKRIRIGKAREVPPESPQGEARGARGAGPGGRISALSICSDPLMTSGREQWSNLRWMRDLLTRPLGEAAGLAPAPLSSGETAADAFSRRRFFALSGIELDGEPAQFWYDDAGISEASLAYLAESGLVPSRLLAGYELSPQTKRLLDRLGVTYIDIWLHPARFYEDILFAFQSNHPEIDAALAPFHVPEAQLRLYADRIRIQSYKGWRRDMPDPPPGSAAFFGQTLHDKSVCRDGRMLSLLDFLDEFDALGARVRARGGRVLYQRHPFLRGGDAQVLEAVAARPWAELSRAPTYPLLSSPGLEEVMTISSSVAQEARYFGKRAEILFRPMIRYDDPARPDQFHSICQDFVSPHFWAALLAPVMPVRAVEPVRFLDPKDKIRDMLGFYWSWRQIDKTEAMRADLDALRRPAPGSAPESGPDPASAPPAPPPAPPDPPDFRGFANTRRGMEGLTRRIDAAETVSFDIFETLLERVLEKPEHLFLFMAPEVRRRLDGAIPNFVQARRAARGWALEQGLASGEEVTLAARCRAMATRFGLAPEHADWLLAHELDWERRLLRARAGGREAFAHARAAGKRIVLVSDTYFDRAFLEERLAACGYAGWDALYASSEIGLLKRSGALFAHLLKAEGRDPEAGGDPSGLLHVGDNLKIDVKQARAHGLSAHHMRATMKVARRISPLPVLHDRIADPRAASAVKGLTGRRLAGETRRGTAGFTQGSAGTLGYAVLGPMFFAFADWIRRRAAAEGVEELFFLSRDGEIARRCYDVIAAHDPGAARSRYLPASRRALGVATLRDAEGLAERAGTAFAPCALDALMRRRFGVALDRLPASARARHGFDGPAPRVAWREDRARLAAFAADPEVAEILLAQAEEEAEALRACYAERGATPARARRAAVVDIGHRGTLQKALRGFLEAPELRGYYFVTFAEIARVLPDAERRTAGFLADRMRSRGADYLRHLQMYETVFLNDADSFVRARRGPDGALALETLEGEGADEARRKAFARESHDGAVAFCADMMEAFGPQALRLRLSAQEAQEGFARMLAHPFPADARLFRGLSFENLYGGRGVKYLLPPEEAPEAEAIWAEGLACLSRPRAEGEEEADEKAAPAPRPRGLTGRLGALLRRG